MKNELYKIVDEDNNIIVELEGLSLLAAENKLTDLLNEGADAYLTEDC